MITVKKTGDYRLIGTKGKTMLLVLDSKQSFAWINAKGIGEILVYSVKRHTTDTVLAMGKFRLYEVKNEPDLTDLQHLELLVGKGKWQGYLLPTGLPDETDNRKRIIPTEERITCCANTCPVSPNYDTAFSRSVMFWMLMAVLV